MSNELITGEVRELDQRMSDKLVVTLWWVEGTMDTFVTVQDDKFEQSFSVDVPDPSLAGHYFRHAMAYTTNESEKRNLYAATESDNGRA